MLYEGGKENMDQRNKLKAYLAAITFSILVGFTFIGVKICVPLANSLEILTHRYNFAFLALVIILLTPWAKINILGKPKKNLMITATAYVAFMVLQVIGLFYATSIESAIIFAIIPIIVKVIASIFLGEKSTMLQNIFVCVTVAALIAMIALGSKDISFNPLGTGILLLSSLSMAISNVYMRYTRNEYTPVEISTAIIVLGFVGLNIVTIGYGLATGTLDQYFAPFKHVEFIIATAYLGIGCILFTVLIMSYILSKMEAVKATIFGNVSTAISIVAGVLVLGESLSWYHIMCTALIIAGVIVISFTGNSKPEEGESQNEI